MARTNQCRICQATDPESGWAGTNHNLCNACVPEVRAQRALQTINESAAKIHNPALQGVMMAGMTIMAGAATQPKEEEQESDV